MENIRLNGDTISHLRQFYERFRLAFHSSFAKPTDILPKFRDIPPNSPFRNILVPHNEYYYGYHCITNTYDWFGSAIYASLTDTKTIPPKLAPLASRVIKTDTTQTDGWNLLYLLLSTRNPLLGGKGDDVITEITNLRIKQDDDIHTFYERVLSLQEKLDYSTETISKTKLLEKYLQAMTQSSTHHHLLQYYLVELHMHIAQEGHNNCHPTMTIQQIYRHLIAINAPTKFQLKNNKKFRPNISHFSSPTDNFEDDEQVSNDTTLLDLKDDNNNNDSSTFILQDDQDQQHYIQFDPTIQAFRHHSNNRSRTICEACGLSGHPANKCFRRGFSFLPRDVQRRISAYNTKYGNTPDKDTSPQNSQKHILPAPDTKLPETTNPSGHSDTTFNTYHTSQATIRTMRQHETQASDETPDNNDEQIEFLNCLEIDENIPTINIISNERSKYNSRSTLTSPTYDICQLPTDILNSKGEVNTPTLDNFQSNIINLHSPTHFKVFRKQCFHIDTGANVHATTNKNDFLLFYEHKKFINIAAGQKTESEGYGVLLVDLIPNHPPTVIAPVYYCPQATTGTLSPQCLHLYNHFRSPTHKLFDHLSLTCPDNNKEIKLSTSQHNNLDFISLPVVHIANDLHHVPTITTIDNSGVNTQLAHQRFDHRSMDTIVQMHRGHMMQGLPSTITRFHNEYTCPICNLTKATRIKRNKIVQSKLPHKKGDFLCMDYSFWNKTSIRGFTSLLSIICMTTRFSFTFPTRHKRPPLATISWLISVLRKQGFSVTYIQTDEGGELGRSSDFLKLLTKHNCIFLGTGRSGSSLNGIIERPNRTIAEAVRAKLLNSGLGDEFWCYAAEDTVFKQRRTLHAAIGTTPYELWFNRKPHYNDMRIFGSHVYVVDTDVTRQKLDPRTFLGIYLKFASTTRVIVFYNPKTKKVGRSSHVYFDETNVGININKKRNLGSQLVHTYPNIPDIKQFDTTTTIHLQDIPILHHPITTYKIILPRNDQTCSLKFYDDETYGIPYIRSIQPKSYIGQQLPQSALTQQYLISIENEEPIHATSASEEYQRLRRTHATKVITLQLSKREPTKPANYEELRSKFDQLRPVIAYTKPHTPNPTQEQCNTNPPLLHSQQHIPTVSILTHSAVKPIAHKNIMQCFQPDNPHSTQWRYTAFHQYDKNASYRVFTKPQPIDTIPPNVDILKSVLASTVKPTETENLWQLGLRHCVNGKQIKGDDKYGPTFAPTISPDTLRFQLAYSAAFNFNLQTGDCSNAFQCTYEPDPTKRIWCYLPPYYIPWWNSRYPHDKIDPKNGPYAMQAAQNIQGTPHAGNRWKKNLDAQLTKHGYICSNIDKAFYTYHSNNELLAMLSTTVDDFLLSFKHPTIRDHFFKFMSEAFDVTTPGYQTQLTFLSLRIYQSEHGISVDQTNHIYNNILSDWSSHKINYQHHDNPMKAHPTYEYELSQSPPLSSKDLEAYEQKYHGAYNHTIGKLLHIQQWTRPDLNFTISRLATFVKSPTSMAFEALDHLISYLYHHMHEPIFYPRKSIGPDELITYQWSPKQQSNYTTKTTYTYHSDAAFANILPDRRSMQADVGLLNGGLYRC